MRQSSSCGYEGRKGGGHWVEALVPSPEAKGKADPAPHYSLHPALQLMRYFPSNDNNNRYHQLSSEVPSAASRSICVVSSNAHNHPRRQLLLLAPSYKGGNQGSERLGNLPKATQPISERNESQIQGCLTPNDLSPRPSDASMHAGWHLPKLRAGRGSMRGAGWANI